MTFGIIGERADEMDTMGVRWANFHQEGAGLVLRAMGLLMDETTEMVGEFAARDVAKECRRILSNAQDPELVRRVRQLASVAQEAGDLGRIWYG